MIQVHVVLSLIGIAAGLVVLVGMVSGRTHDSWTALFLGSTILASLTGFILPHEHLLGPMRRADQVRNTSTYPPALRGDTIAHLKVRGA